MNDKKNKSSNQANMNTYPDSDMQYYSKMVLCVEEYKNPEKEYTDSNIDMRVYVYYNNNKYIIYGKRHETKKSIQKKNGPKYVPFYFECEKKKEMISFIQFITDPDTKVTIGLYNYNNMFDHEICYEYFEQQQDRYYEIIVFDNVILNGKNKTLDNAMNMIKVMNSGVIVNNNWESYSTENRIPVVSMDHDLEPNDIVICKEISEENVNEKEETPPHESLFREGGFGDYTKTQKRREQRKRKKEREIQEWIQQNSSNG